MIDSEHCVKHHRVHWELISERKGVVYVTRKLKCNKCGRRWHVRRLRDVWTSSSGRM